MAVAEEPNNPVASAIGRDAVAAGRPGDSSVDSADNGPKLSLNLPQVIRWSVQNNCVARLADERKAEARARLRESLAALLPQASAVASQSWNTQNVAAMGLTKEVIPLESTFLGPYRSFDARIYFSQSLFNLASIRRYQAGKAGARIAELDDLTVRQQVSTGAALAYIGFLKEGMSVEAARSNLELAQSLAELAKNQHTVGVATGIDVVRADTRVAHEEVRLAQAKMGYQRARLALLRITGQALAEEPVPSDSLAGPNQELPKLAAQLGLAGTERPEIRLAEENARAAKLLRQASQADWLPSLEFVGNYGSSGVTPEENALPTRSIGLRLNIPIYDGGATAARIGASRSRERQAEIGLGDVRIQVEEDVRLALEQLRATAEQVRAAEKSLTLAQKELEQSRDRFAAGVTDNIEVLSAQTALENAREARITALAAYQAARANMASATGLAETFSWNAETNTGR